jgi:L-iditol 2-dehydrogenase
MKAALLLGQQTLRIEELATPVHGAGEVLIKLEACGICRTDMKAFYMGQRDLHLPRVLGHEIAGTVVGVGNGVRGINVGDRVQVAPGLSCGTCCFCRRGWDHLCESVRVMGFHIDGGFAECVLIPARGVERGTINKIPAHLTFNEAVFTEPLACAVNLDEQLGIKEGDTVVIYGAGPLGMLFARLCRVRGARTIILMENDRARLESAAAQDFDYGFNPGQSDAAEVVLNITSGRGADVVIPCCPSQEAMKAGLQMLARRGKFGFFSGLLPDPQAGMPDLNLIHYKELIVYGAYGCSSQHNQTALNLISLGKIQVQDLISNIISLDEVEAGIKMVAGMEGIKTIINY